MSFGNGSMTVAGDAPDEAIASAVARAGYRAHPAARRVSSATSPFWRRDARALSTTISVGLLAIAVVASLASAPRIVAEPLYLLSMAVGGWPIARAAALALGRRRLDMNVLMALAAVGAVGIGEYAEGAWVLVLFAVGTGLEAMALERSRRTVASLMDLAPARARVIADGAERLVDVEAVEVGALIAIRPGERIALDANVESGTSSVDQAPITGESVPVDKQAGDELFAGTLNTTGALVARTTPPGSRFHAFARRVAGRGRPGQPRARPSASSTASPRSTRRSCSRPRSRWRPCRSPSAATAAPGCTARSRC